MNTEQNNSGEIVRQDLTEQDSNAPLVQYSDEDVAEFKCNIEKKLAAATKELEYFKSFVVSPENEKRVYAPDRKDDDTGFDKEQLDQMVVRQQTFIDHLNAALQRIENKTYGICRVTGKLIDKARLLAVPHATLSLEAKKGNIKNAPDVPVIEEPKNEKKKRTSKKEEKQGATVHYPDDDLRQFKTLISNKIDATNEEIKVLKVVKADREKGIAIEDYETMSPAEVQALIDRKKSYAEELEKALDRIKKKTYGVDQSTGQLIPKPVLIDTPVITRLVPTPEVASSVQENNNPPKEELKKRACRICGCTEDNACIDPNTNAPCYWIDVDLCSACEEKAMEESENATQPADELIEPVGSSTADEQLIIKPGGATIELSEAEKKHLAELDNNISLNDNIMNFFQQLAQAGAQKVDLTMRIMQKENKLTVNIIPGVKSNSVKPLLITGTPQELDEGFFKTMTPVITDITGLVTNAEDVKKDLQQNKTAAASAPVKKQAQKSSRYKPGTKKPEKKAAPKKAAKKVEKKAPVKEEKVADAEPNMFG